MDYFGPKWDAPVTDPPAQQVQTPVGTDCLLCGEPIEEDHSGVVQPHLIKGEWDKAYIHKECLLRNVVGSPSHIGLSGACPHRGGEHPDDNMTYREQALEVWRRKDEL